MNTDNVSLIEVIAAARRQYASLVVESSGYLLLAISRGMGGLAVDIDAGTIMLRTDGALTLTGPRSRCAADKAANTMRQLAVRLLDVSIGKSVGLRAAVRPIDDARNPLDRLITGVTKALIPINRGAAKRALARLARETIRAKKRGQLRPEDIEQEAEETRLACLGSAAAAPASSPPEPVFSGTPVPYALPATRPNDPPPTPSGLSQFDVDVEMDLLTPTPPPGELSLELRTVTPPPAQVEPFSPSLPLARVAPRRTSGVPATEEVATYAVSVPNTPTCSEASESPEDVHDRVTATDPDDFAARAARMHDEFDEPGSAPVEAPLEATAVVADEAPARPPAEPVPTALPDPPPYVAETSPAETSPAGPSPAGPLQEEPEVLEDFKITDDQDQVDADLQSDVSDLVECALKQIDDMDIAGADFSPLQASARYTPSPAALGTAVDDSSVESMLAGFGGEGENEALDQAANSLNEMMRLDLPERGREISQLEKQALAKLNADDAADDAVHAPAPPCDAPVTITPSSVELSPEVVIEFEFDKPSQPPALPRSPKTKRREAIVAEPEQAELDQAETAQAAPDQDEVLDGEGYVAAEAALASSSEEDGPESAPRAYIHDDSWLGNDPDTESGGNSIPPTFVVERPRAPRSPMILSALLLLTGLGAAGLLWKKPELYQQLKTMGSEALTTPAASTCYAPLAMRDLPAQHEVLLHLGELGSMPLSTPLPTGVRLELVVTSTKHQAKRVVVAADDEWSAAELGLQRTLQVDLSEGFTATWPAASAGEVGGVGPAGKLVVEGNVPGAEVWLVVGAGGGETAQISVPCDSAARLLVVDTSTTLRQRQLHVQPELLRAAARSGGAELSGKL